MDIPEIQSSLHLTYSQKTQNERLLDSGLSPLGGSAGTSHREKYR
jgi:hypothetical protein